MSKENDKVVRNYTIEDLEKILDKLPHQVWLKDKQGKYIYINKACAEKVGLSKNDIIGKSDYEFRDYEVAKKCVETDISLINNNNYIYNEEHTRINDQDIWYKVHKFILTRSEMEEDIIGGIAKEITLNKNIQLKLEKILLNYLDVNSNEDDSMKILHSILKSLKKFLKCNNIEILLYDEEKKVFNSYLSEDKSLNKFNNTIHINKEIENKLCSNEVDENRYSEIYDKILQLQDNNVEDSFKIKHIELANKLFALVCISYSKGMENVYNDDSYLYEILTKIAIIIKQIKNKREISSINKKKNELEAIIELESIKTEFFANVSHEFRTPVNIILSIVQLLKSYSEDTNMNFKNEKYKEYLNILRQNSYRLLRLVNNIIDTAKVSNSFYDLILGNYNIVSLVENITMSTVGHANEKNKNIIFDTDQEEVILACDPIKIEKVIINLISNAIKFSDYNTDIEVKIKTDLDLNRVFISVKNYGEKIEKEDKELIFAKFTQVDNLLTRRSEGSGIGLYLARKFVEMHNGKIYVDNIKDGTQLTFYLPIKCIKEGEIYNQIIDESDIIERCNIELSDI